MSTNGGSVYEESGAGGKFRRKPLRKSQATPYDRPPTAFRNTNTSGGGGNGWLSKIVDPASKIITACAHRLYSTVYRKRLLPPPAPRPAARQDASEVYKTADTPRSEIQFQITEQSGNDDRHKEYVSQDNNSGNQGISELEKIFATRNFTESEINRLTALLNSRTVEVTSEKASEARAGKTKFELGNSSEFKPSIVPDNSINRVRFPGGTSSHVSSDEVIEEDIATPAELAKAYMVSRPSKVSPSMLGSRSQTIRSDLPLTNSVVFPSQSPSMRTAIKPLSSIGVPENDYMTPRSRGRSAVYSMARTPYSRPLKSPQLASEAITLSSARQKAFKRPSDVLEEIGSAGPTRRIRHKPSLLSSQRTIGAAGRSSPNNGPEVISNYHSKNAGSGKPDANLMSVPSQSSVVAQKILQQLDKLSPSPNEKSSERKSMQPPGNPTFTLTPDLMSGKARGLEKDSPKIMESSPKNSKLGDSVKAVASHEDFTFLNGKNQVEEKDPQEPAGISKNNSVSAFHSSEHHLSQNKQSFEISACEEKKTKTNGDQNGIIPNESIKFEKEGKVYYSPGPPIMATQPTASDNISSSLFDKVSSGEQSAITPLFGYGEKVSDKLSPFKFTSSPSGEANDSIASQKSALPESTSVKLSELADTPKIKAVDSEDTQRDGDMDAKASTNYNGISTASAFFSSGSFANNGFANCVGGLTSNSVVSPTASVPNATTGNSSSGSLFSTSVAPLTATPVFGLTPRKDPQASSDTNFPPSDTAKPITAVGNATSNPFAGTSFATANGTHLFYGFGSSMSSPVVDNQGLASVSNAVSSQANTATSAAESTQQNKLFKFGSTGISSAPMFGLSETTNSAPVSAMNSLPASIFGQNSSSMTGSVGSCGGSTNSLFGSNWKPNSSPLFGSTTSSTAVPPSVFQFGSSPSMAASTPSSSNPGSLFGSSNASAVSTFSFTSAATSNSPSPFSTTQPVTGSSSPAFAFGSLPNSSNNKNQTSMDDTMVEDTNQMSAPSTSVFGKPQPVSNSVFSFGSPSPSVTPPPAVFQFGGQPSPAASLNQTPFQASGSFNAGGGFSIGSGDGDKSGRKIIKVKRGPKRR